MRSKGGPGRTLLLSPGTYTLPLVHHTDTVERVRVANTSLQASLRREARAESHSEIGHKPPKTPTQGGGPGSVLADQVPRDFQGHLLYSPPSPVP